MRILAHHDNFRVQHENTTVLPAQYNAPSHAFLAHKNFTDILQNAAGAYGGNNFVYMTYMPSARSNHYQLDLMLILSLTAAYNLNREQINALKAEISNYDDRNKTIDYILLNSQVMKNVCAPQVIAPAPNRAEIEKQIQNGLRGILGLAKAQKVAPQINSMIMAAYNQPLINRINIERLPAPMQKYFTGADQTYFKGRSYVQLLEDLNPQPVQRVNPALDGMKAEAKASYDTLFSLYIRASEENRNTAERIFGRQAVIFGGNLVPIQPNGFMPAAPVGPVVNPNPVNPLLYSINQINGVYEINGIREGQPGFAALVNAAPPSIIGLLPARLRGQNPVPPLNNLLNNWGNLIYPNPVMPPVNPFAPVNPPPLNSILPSNLTTVAIANGDTKVTKANHQTFIRELLTDFDKTTIIDNLKNTPGPFQFLISELTQTFEMSDDLTAVMKSLTKKQIQTLFDLTKGGLREDFLSGSVTQESLRQLTDAFFRTLTDGNLSVRNAFPGESLETRKSNFDDIFLSLNLMQTDKRIQRQYRNNRYMTVPTGYGGLRTPNIRETQAIIIYCAIVSAFKNDADEVVVAPNPSPNPNPAPVMPGKRPNPNPNPGPNPTAPPVRPVPVALPVEEIEIPDEVIAGFYAEYEDNPSAFLTPDEFVEQESARYRLRMSNQRPQVNSGPQNAPVAGRVLTGATYLGIIKDVLTSDASFYPASYSEPLTLSASYPYNGEINRLKIHYLSNSNGLVVKMLSYFSTDELKLLFKMNHNLYANDRDMRIRKDYKGNQFIEALYRDNERHTAFYEKMKTQMGYQSDEAVKEALKNLFELLDFELVVPTDPLDQRKKVLPHYLVMRAVLLATSEFNDQPQNPGLRVNPKNPPPKGAFVLPPVGEMKKRPVAPQGDAKKSPVVNPKRPVMPPRPKVNPNPNPAPVAPAAPVQPVVVPPTAQTLTRANLAAELDKIVSNSAFFSVLGIEGGKINMLDNHSQYAQSINALKSVYAQDEVAMILKHLSTEHFHLFFEVGMYQVLGVKITAFLQQINNGVEDIPASLKQRMLADEELGIYNEDEMRDVIKKALDHIAFNYVQGLPNTIEPHCLDKKILHYLIRVAAVQSVFEAD